MDVKINETRLRMMTKHRSDSARRGCKSNEVVTRTNPYRDRNFMRSRNGELTFSGYAVLSQTLRYFPPFSLLRRRRRPCNPYPSSRRRRRFLPPCSHSQSARFLSLTVILILLPRGPPTSSNVRLLST